MNTPDPEETPAPERRLDVPFGPPFGPAFFLTVLADRVREQCDQQPDAIPVIELHLADGVTLDLCHVAGVGPQWMAAVFFRDRETCEEMDTSFVPYGLITRVTVSMWHRSQRRIGFDLEHPIMPIGSVSDQTGADSGTR